VYSLQVYIDMDHLIWVILKAENGTNRYTRIGRERHQQDLAEKDDSHTLMTPITPQHLCIRADFDELIQIEPFVGLVAQCLAPISQAQLMLALHELCMNIIRHAYIAGIDGKIDLYATAEGEAIRFSVEDRGPNPYVELDQPSPDPLALPEGGWGMSIIRDVMDGVWYERLADGRNRWTLLKRLTT
jgi:anti-sigma regulatory factor (Ser/Thr protein kinase)